MTVLIHENVAIGPRGLRLVGIVDRFYPKSSELAVWSAYRAREADGGTWSYHNGVITYGGSGVCAVDFSENDSVVGSYQGNFDHPAARAMRDFAKWWWDHFGDLTPEMFHTTPYADDNGFNVRNQVKGVAGIPDHGDHVHLAASEALMDQIEARIAHWGWRPIGEAPQPPANPTPIPGDDPPVGGPGATHNVWIADLYDYTWNMGLREHHVQRMVTQEGMWGLNAKISEMASNGRWIHSKATHLLNVGVDNGLAFPLGFIVPRTGPSIADQVEFALETIDAACSWWRNHPDFTFQVDLEDWGYDKPSGEMGAEMAQYLRQVSGKPVFLYGSAGHYGNSIPDYPGRVLWNANYNGSGARRQFNEMYLGDSAPGWVHYSGQNPSLLQYCSDGLAGGWVPNTTPGGLAMTVFRGTPDEFRTLRRYALGQGQGGSTVSVFDEKIGPYSAPTPDYAEHSFRTAAAWTWAMVNRIDQKLNNLNVTLSDQDKADIVAALKNEISTEIAAEVARALRDVLPDIRVSLP